MFRIIFVTFCLIFLGNSHLFSKENDIFNWHPGLVGQWAGKWDDVYDIRLAISEKSDGDYSVVYEWKEGIHKGFSKAVYTGKVMNANTIDFHKISLRIELKDKNKAIAFGKFDLRTRIAYLTKVK